MGPQLQTQIELPAKANATRPQSSALQRKCACGNYTVAGGECRECGKTKGLFQRKPVNGNSAGDVPSIVHEVLRSPGRPLDATTRAFMEPCFGHDFSSVRVHTDAKAAASTQAVNALAYTVGPDIVFGAGQYAPQTTGGRKLLAHELTHALQRPAGSGGLKLAGDGEAEREAERNGDRLGRGEALRVDAGARDGTIQRQLAAPDKKKDQDALEIINFAKSNGDPKQTAIDVLWRIIRKYYSSDAAKVKEVVYDDKKAGAGLSTDAVYDASQKMFFGKIYVGSNFLEEAKGGTHGEFAHAVLRVGHEIEHIDQHRQGMVGPGKQCEREFLAFYHEALAPEKAGTGFEPRTTRVSIIDAAIGYFYCLEPAVQKQYATQLQELQSRRQAELIEITNRHYPNPPSPNPPTTCRIPESAVDCRTQGAAKKAAGSTDTQGLSTGTKILIGLGALAGVAGVIGLIASQTSKK